MLSGLTAQIEPTVRGLVTALQRIEQGFQRETVAPTLANIERWLQSPAETPALALAVIAHEVADAFQVTLTGLRSASRQQALLLPRQCAMFLARELTAGNLADIGRFFGGRDHSTVVHSCQRLKELLEQDPDLRSNLNQIRHALGAASAESAL